MRAGVRVGRVVTIAAVAAAAMVIAPVAAAAGPPAFLNSFTTVSEVASTIPANGDINPYGVAVVPQSIGDLVAGDVLVSNFNDGANAQGTGRTIVEVSPGGAVTLFAQLTPASLHGACPGGVGLTTALGILNQRWVIVGSLPTTDGTAATAQAGCLIVLNSNGQAVETISGKGVNGPWDLTAVNQGRDSVVFVTNVIDGTVERLVLETGSKRTPAVHSRTRIGSGFAHRSDPNALFIGPTGVAVTTSGVLYVADTLSNRIAAIPHAYTRKHTAFTGEDVSANGSLNGPLGLALAPNGDILTVNSLDGNIIETTPDGTQVASPTIGPSGAGTLFGLAVKPGGAGVYFVDDGTNQLNLFS